MLFGSTADIQGAGSRAERGNFSLGLACLFLAIFALLDVATAEEADLKKISAPSGGWLDYTNQLHHLECHDGVKIELWKNEVAYADFHVPGQAPSVPGPPCNVNTGGGHRDVFDVGQIHVPIQLKDGSPVVYIIPCVLNYTLDYSKLQCCWDKVGVVAISGPNAFSNVNQQCKYVENSP